MGIIPTNKSNPILTRLHSTLAINKEFNSMHYKLRDLETVFVDIFYISRLKLAFVSTPAETVNTQHKLNKGMQGTNATNSIKNTASNTKHIKNKMELF